MLAKVYTCAVIGLDAQIVEVDTGRGLPAFFIVGLPDAAVKESSERVRSAIKNSGLRMHDGRIIVNLAPADLRKAGPAYDLPMALGVLVATDQIPDVDLDQAVTLHPIMGQASSATLGQPGFGHSGPHIFSHAGPT